ncbi:hypothetical protein OUZ56_032915 [Daphnia magna]|uniref:Uncharacterized protein n=1 Tax=Daphnia magna TaxID=35525 RepID=A0ABQ9ZX68_9CRUS|nr:hypothetical protein OUZ56_032915 [Daphnia magna]
MSPASDIQERGVDIAALNDSIARHHGEKFNVSFVSSNYSLGSDEEDLATARYVESTYRIPSPRDREYRCPTLEWKGSETDAWSEEGEDWPRSSTSKLDEKWIGFPVEVAGGAEFCNPSDETFHHQHQHAHQIATNSLQHFLLPGCEANFIININMLIRLQQILFNIFISRLIFRNHITNSNHS